MAYVGARLSKMAKHRIGVTTSLESANFLLGEKENINEEEFGFLATLPYCVRGRSLPTIGRE
jgi:hypothetical protein